jgi:hypothetical protein
MKKLLLFSVILLALNNEASAFLIEANCNFNQSQGRCTVWNNYNRPIFCRFEAAGLTYLGFWIEAWQDAVIPPRANGTLRVFATNPNNDPLVQVNGRADCNF